MPAIPKRRAVQAAEQAATDAPPRPALSRERIVAAALGLLDEVGLDGLTMRRLAEALAVQAGALYRHVRDKDELLDLLMEAICAEQAAPDPTLPWREQLRRLAAEQLRVLRSRRDAARIAASTPPNGPERLRLIDATLGALLLAGFDEAMAMQGAMLLNSYVTGLLLEEESGPRGATEGTEPTPEIAGAWESAIASGRYPSLAHCAMGLRDPAELGVEARFAFGLEVLLVGLEGRLRDVVR